MHCFSFFLLLLQETSSPLDGLPSDWTVLCLSVVKTKQGSPQSSSQQLQLLFQVHEGGKRAVTFQKSVELKGLLDEFEEIMVANSWTTSLKCTSACKTSTQKREWRKSREKLDKQLGTFLSNLEKVLGLEVSVLFVCVLCFVVCVFGCFGCFSYVCVIFSSLVLFKSLRFHVTLGHSDFQQRQ